MERYQNTNGQTETAEDHSVSSRGSFCCRLVPRFVGDTEATWRCVNWVFARTFELKYIYFPVKMCYCLINVHQIGQLSTSGKSRIELSPWFDTVARDITDNIEGDECLRPAKVALAESCIPHF
jgi:hypothetical protein